MGDSIIVRARRGPHIIRISYLGYERCLYCSCLFSGFLLPRYFLLPTSYTATAYLTSCEDRLDNSPMSPLVQCQGDPHQYCTVDLRSHKLQAQISYNYINLDNYLQLNTTILENIEFDVSCDVMLSYSMWIIDSLT